MDDINQYFVLPLLALVASGGALYLIRTSKQRSAVREALKSEVNLLLRQAMDYRTYLSHDNHRWLKEGEVLHEAPVFVPSSYRVFTASLPYFYLLSRGEIGKVLGFYSAHESCEQLIQILFERIGLQDKSNQPLTARQIQLTKSRVKRIVASLDKVCQITNLRIISLKDLPETYELPSANDFTAEMRKAFEAA